jgi:hypothetical protein
MMRRISSVFIVCLALSSLARAQPQRVEAWGGLTLVAANLDATYTTQYVPLIENYSPPLAGSSAGQTVNLIAGRTWGLGAGVNVFFSPHVGVQFLFDADSRTLSGENGSYAVVLNYTARQPPDYVERTYSTAATYTACDASQSWGCVLPTTGTLEQRTLGFNIVGRWKAGPRVNVELSGGLTYAEVRADDAASLRYSSYHMGGHSTLFSSEYQLAYAIGPAHGYGVNAGVTFDVGMGKAAALTIDTRFVAAPTIRSPLTVSDIRNKDAVSMPQDLGTIQQNLHPPDAAIASTRLRVLVGVKLRM